MKAKGKIIHKRVEKLGDKFPIERNQTNIIYKPKGYALSLYAL